MIVIDASVLTHALIDDGVTGDKARALLLVDGPAVVPAHFSIEVFSAVRRWVLAKRVTVERGRRAVVALGEFGVQRRVPDEFYMRMWELRDNVSAYDAAYVALAESLGCALLTADAKLAAATGPDCEIRLLV